MRYITYLICSLCLSVCSLSPSLSQQTDTGAKKTSLIPMQKTFIRKINSQLTLRHLFCFYAHNPGFLILLVSAISDLWRPILNSCLAQSRHHLPTLRCQMLLLFASSCRISDTAQQPSAELSPPPLTSQLFCRLSSSYSNTGLQFP